MAARPSPDPESRRLELQEAIVTFRHHASLGTQAAAALLTADSVLVAYGLVQRESGILLIASLTPLVIQAVTVVLVDAALPYIYTALVLEQELELTSAPLVRTAAQRLFKPVAAAVANCTDVSDAAVRDAVLGIPWRAWIRSRTAVAYYVTFVVQFTLFIISLAVYHYRFM